jgi:hypothetical protein
MSFIVNFGRYGGFYFYRGYGIRLCLGWVAFTILPGDFDELITELNDMKRNPVTTSNQ